MAGITALVTNGIGPGSSVLFVLTGGLGIGEALPQVVETPRAGGGFAPEARWVRHPEERRRYERDPLRDDLSRLLKGEADGATESEASPDVAAPRVPETRRRFLLETAAAPAIDVSPAISALDSAGRAVEALAQTNQDDEACLMLILSLAA